MSNRIERVVALVTCANVYIQENETKFDLEPIIHQYCYGMEFIDYAGPYITNFNRVIASSAKTWFEHLQKEKPMRVRLHFKPWVRSDIPKGLIDEIIRCGSNWLIETQYNTINRLYIPIINPRERGVSPLIKTDYALFEGATKNLDDISPSVSEARRTLDQLLEKLSDFTGKFRHSKYWTYRFNLSRRILENFEPSESEDLVLSDIYSKEAYRLLQAALCSWVFGGTGFWNNLFVDEEYSNQHSMLSLELYETICDSICSVINSFP